MSNNALLARRPIDLHNGEDSELLACDFFDSRAIPYEYLAKDTLSPGGVDIRIGNLEIDFKRSSIEFWPETWGGLYVHVKEQQHQQDRGVNLPIRLLQHGSQEGCPPGLGMEAGVGRYFPVPEYPLPWR